VTFETPDAAIDAHLAAEQSGDVDAMVATTSADVAYEFPLQGMRFVGQKAARVFYAAGPEAELRGDAGAGVARKPLRAIWRLEGTRIFEADGHPLMTGEGAIEQHTIAAVVIGGPEGVTHERMYVSDRAFELLTDVVRDHLEPMT